MKNQGRLITVTVVMVLLVASARAAGPVDQHGPVKKAPKTPQRQSRARKTMSREETPRPPPTSLGKAVQVRSPPAGNR